MDRSHGFQILKPWRMQLFIRPDIRRNLTDEKKPIHNRHIHIKMKKDSGNGCAIKREDEKSRQNNVSCNDFEKKSSVTTHSFLSKYQSP